MTKKLFIFSILFITSCIIIGSCKSKNKAPKVLTLSTTKAVIDTTASLTDEITCCVRVSFSYLKGDKYAASTDSLLRMGLLQPDYFSIRKDHLTPQQALAIFAKQYIKDYFDIARFIRQHEKQNAKTKGELLITTTLTAGESNNVVATANISVDDGSGTKTNYSVIRNFDPTTGKVITLKDRYGNDKEELNSMLLEAFGKKLDIEEPTLENIQNKDLFKNIDIYPANNYILTDDSTVFIYNPGEISSKGVRIAIEK